MTQQIPVRPPQSPRQSNLRRNVLILGTISVIGTVIGGIALQIHLDKTTYREAETAYQNADCATAVEQFDRLLNRWRLVDTDDYVARSKALKAECAAYQAGINPQQAGQVAAALTAYAEFAKSYSNSPLLPSVRQQIESLLPQVNVTTIAHLPLCNQLNTLTDQKLLAEPERHLPVFYQACGQEFAKNGDFDQAIPLYQQFLSDYPNHASAETVRAELAKLFVQQARRDGAGTIEQPPVSGNATLGSVSW